MAEDNDKRTPVKLRPVARKHAGKVTEPWKILERLLHDCEEFEDVAHAAFRLFWRKDWQVDADGVVIGAQVCRASERERLIAETNGDSLDLQILLPEDAWGTLDDTEKEHRIYHELLHCRAARDSNGDQKYDSKDRPLFRLRRHPIVAFHEEIERYGIDRVIGHNQKMVDAAEDADRPLFAGQEEADKKLPLDKRPIDSLAIGVRQLKSLEKAGFDTVGKLRAKMIKDCDWWHRDIGGIGPNSKVPIEDAVNAAVPDVGAEAAK